MKSKLQMARDEIAESNRVISLLRADVATLRVDNRAGASQVEGLRKELTDARHALSAEEKRFQCMSERLLRQEAELARQQGTITQLRLIAHTMVDAIGGKTEPSIPLESIGLNWSLETTMRNAGYVRAADGSFHKATGRQAG